jgi:hypothetical protein
LPATEPTPDAASTHEIIAPGATSAATTGRYTRKLNDAVTPNTVTTSTRATAGLASTDSRVRNPAAGTVTLGSARTATATTTAIPAIPHMTPRQPTDAPANTPIGTPSTLDTETPAATQDSARPRFSPDAVAPATTKALAWNAAAPIAATTRAPASTANVVPTAWPTIPTTKITIPPQSSTRRSSLPVNAAMSGEPTA